MEHVCTKQQEIETMKIDLAVAKSDITAVKNDIKEIKTSIDKGNAKIMTLMYWIMGGMGTVIAIFLGILVKK